MNTSATVKHTLDSQFGRYEALRMIGRGGMATVYLGRAKGEGGFERLVALKVMHPHLACEPEFVDMFLDEARLAARIRNPHVVGTIAVERLEDGRLFLVMDYIEGPSLHEVMQELSRRGLQLPPSIALRIVIDMLTGLHAAHELRGADRAPLRLVHRDVSLQNVLVGTDGLSRITDFGVARAEERLTTTKNGQIKGKLAYMSPEQVRGEAIDRRSDIYAAGVVLFQLLTGQRPLQGQSSGELVHRILQGVQRSPRQLDPRLPEPLDRVCLRALRLVPRQRYQTAAAFTEALEEAARQSGVPVATPREVAVLVDDLAVHAPPESYRLSLSPRPGGGPPPLPRSDAELNAEPVGVELELPTDSAVTTAITTSGVRLSIQPHRSSSTSTAMLQTLPSRPAPAKAYGLGLLVLLLVIAAVGVLVRDAARSGGPAPRDGLATARWSRVPTIAARGLARCAAAQPVLPASAAPSSSSTITATSLVPWPAPPRPAGPRLSAGPPPAQSHFVPEAP